MEKWQLEMVQATPGSGSETPNGAKFQNQNKNIEYRILTLKSMETKTPK